MLTSATTTKTWLSRGSAIARSVGLRRWPVAAFVALMTAACSNGGERSPPKVEEVDKLMAAYAGNVPGASVLVLHNGTALVRRAYGFADLEARKAAALDTNYRLASVTKQFTAASILLLMQDGALQLDDSISKWFPDLPLATKPITVRQLLSHTSGLIDYEEVIPADLTRQLNDADVPQILKSQDRTYFAPGTSYRYSNSGYALLALIVEQVSGKSFSTFLRERIFQPLLMTNTVAHQESVSVVPHRAYGYTLENGQWNRTDQSQTSAVLGDGGIYSSIDDLARWDAALYDERILTDASRELAFTAATKTDDPRIEYGMGWRITHEEPGGTTLWHSGESRGFRNVIVRYPDYHLTVIVLTNRDDPEPYETARKIAALYLKQP